MKSEVLEVAHNLVGRADRIVDRYAYSKNYVERKTLLDERLFGEQTTNWSECVPLQINTLLDTHLPQSKGVAEKASMCPLGCLGQTEGSKVMNLQWCTASSSPPSDTSEEPDWFQSIHRLWRVSYDDQFVKTQPHFEEVRQSTGIHWLLLTPSPIKAWDHVTWDHVSGETWRLSYHPVQDLNRNKDFTNHFTTWKIDVFRPGIIAVPFAILAGLTIGWGFVIWRRDREQSFTQQPNEEDQAVLKKSRVALTCGGLLIGCAIIACDPQLTLEIISWAIALTLLAWLVYSLSAITARRILLLNLQHYHSCSSFLLLEHAARDNFRALDKKRQIFVREFGATERLREIGKRVLNDQSKLSSLRSLLATEQTLITLALDEAGLHYDVLWEDLSSTQKLALFHLAKTGFLSSTHPDLENLLQRGLIVLDVGLRLMNESFRRYVLLRENDVAPLEREIVAGAWNNMNWPIGIGLVLVLAGLMYTQQDLLTALGAFLGALATLFPQISKLLDSFRGGKTSPNAG